MVRVFAVLLVVHGAIHLLGAAEAFHWAELPQLTQPIPEAIGVFWMVSAVLFVATAVLLFAWPRGWWVIGFIAVAVSMCAVVPSWADAKVGALANAIVLVGVAFGFLSQGPFSLRAQYLRDVQQHARPTETAAITAEDLEPLPVPVRRYLRFAGVVGQSRVREYRVRMQGRIRDGRQGRWMPFTAEQRSFVRPPARLFYLDASMLGVPVQGYHRYVGSAASMRIKAAALIPVVDARGPEMTQSETVTLFNDMCLLAPATLIDPAIQWQTLDAHTVMARFSNAGYVVGATLSFDDDGRLTNFISDDRYQSSEGGRLARRVRWSTPVGGYRRYDRVRLFSQGEGVWHEPDGEYAYIELTVDEVEYNPESR